jgi:hypothetical protein
MTPSPEETVARLHALIRALRGGEADSVPFVDALTDLRELRVQLAAWEPELVTAARSAGLSWITLAPALGVTSRQAAERRYLRSQPTGNGESTKERRVDTTRDQRAGERAVAAWARENSAELRQLAGQVSGLDDLTAAGRRDADRVHTELAGDDTATLLEPLTTMRSHLADGLAGHAELADRIGTAAQNAETRRRDAVDKRQSSRSQEDDRLD